MFEPRSIAVIGASRRKDAVGYAILNNLLKASFQGSVYPVNPKADSLEGLKCYSSILKIDGEVDLAVIILPSGYVLKVIEECVEKKVGSIIIISAGFREVGEEGRKIEDEVVRAVREKGISLLGPNCLGLINTDPNFKFNASFSRFMPSTGNVAFISQSGALCTSVLDYAKEKNIGFSKFISMGNKADISVVDLLDYLKEDSQTDVILMYVEDIVDGERFVKAAQEIAQKKPILVIKSGRTPQGAKAASSHTGSLMGSDEVYNALFKQSGILRLDSIADVLNCAVAFSYQSLPLSSRVAIITNAGGPGIMATDACVHYGLEIAELEESTVQALKKHLPATANFSNPIDVIGDAKEDRYEKVLEEVILDPNVDSIIILLTPQAMTNIEDIAHVIVKASKKTKKTLLVSFMGGADIAPGVKILEKSLLPHYPFPEDAARTLMAMTRYHEMRKRPNLPVPEYIVDNKKASEIIEEAKKKGESFLTIKQSMDIFQAYGLPLLPYGFAQSSKEAVSIAKEVGFPVVLKIISSDIIHKFDFGGVKLHLKDEFEVESGYNDMIQSILIKMPRAKIDGVFVQAMGESGREVILGMDRDPLFGPMLMFGLGGIYVEAIKDVSFSLAPIRDFDALEMIKEIRAYPILEGIRGERPADIDVIVESLERLSQLSCEHPDIKEIDINPLLVYEKGKGAKVIDARIILT